MSSGGGPKREKKRIREKTTKKTNKRNSSEAGEAKREEEEDWIAALARRESAPAPPPASSSASAAANASAPTSKAERVERRNAKKRRREERLAARRAEARADKAARSKRQRGVDGGERSGKGAAGNHGKRRNGGDIDTMAALSLAVRRIVDAVHGDGGDDGDGKRRRLRPFADPSSTIKGKSTRESSTSKLVRTDPKNRHLQPRPRDYNGLGLQRPSLYLPLHDHSFKPKFEQEFEEHVEGFYGKQRTKAMKRQLDGDMLWRRLVEGKRKECGGEESGGDNEGGGKKKKEKKSRGGSESWGDRKVDGRRLADMTPDERVEAMIKVGMV